MIKTASSLATVGLGALIVSGLAGAGEQPARTTAVSPAAEASASMDAPASGSAPADELSEVVVTTGFRESLVRAANIKRNEAIVSDVIAA